MTIMIYEYMMQSTTSRFAQGQTPHNEKLIIIALGGAIVITQITQIIIKRRSGINPIPPTVNDRHYKKKQSKDTIEAFINN